MTHPVFAYSHALVDRLAIARPTAATFWGVPGHDHRWDDQSPEGVAAFETLLLQAIREADALPPPITHWDALAKDVLCATLHNELTRIRSGEPWRHLAHIASPFQMLHLTLSHMQSDTPEQQASRRARLETLPEALLGYRAALAHGLAIGEVASARQVRSCIEQGHQLVANRLLDVVPDAPEASDRAHQAYADLTEWLGSTYLPHAHAHDGVGEAAYLPAVHSFLHEPIDLDATYAWGWENVQALHTDLQAVLARVAPGRTLAQAVEGWRTDPTTSAPDAEAFLTQVRTWQSKALADLQDVLPVPDIAKQLRIERAPIGLPPGAWYMQPSENGDRSGVVQYSLQDGRVPWFDQQSTGVHEGFPGHHLQLSIQTTLQHRLSRVHRVAFECTGFAEGWALYAERLVDERGGYDNDVQRAGYLVNQIARACRVVIDIGLHTGRPIANLPFVPHAGQPFTYERAVDVMTEVGGLRRQVSESEITRYLGWPGQAISYAVGMKRLLDLRETFLGRGGSLRDFHERALGSGTVGLGRLAKEVLRDL